MELVDPAKDKHCDSYDLEVLEKLAEKLLEQNDEVAHITLSKIHAIIAKYQKPVVSPNFGVNQPS